MGLATTQHMVNSIGSCFHLTRITYSPSDSVLGDAQLSEATVVGFWQWAFGDLCDDDIKGIFAEWLVHKLLHIQTLRRCSWANSDIITPGGTRIEVKSTAYWQTWKFLNEYGELEETPKHKALTDDNKIRFAGLMARDSTSTDWSKTPTFKSDLYVFAFQSEKEIEKWNALDLNQWEFFLVSAAELSRLGWKSISLTTLRKQFGSLTATELASRGRMEIAQIEKANNNNNNECPT